jgi:hypothetical protein
VGVGWEVTSSTLHPTPSSCLSAAPPPPGHPQLREPAIILPAVTESMRSIRAARVAYTERFPGAFVAPNVDEALGEIIAPSDERTVTGYLSAEAGPWELSHWLRSASGGSEVAARVGILRHHLAREHATDPRVVHRVRGRLRSHRLHTAHPRMQEYVP